MQVSGFRTRERRSLVKQLRQTRRSRARTLCACTAVAVTALLAACSSGPPATGSDGSSHPGGSVNAQLLAFSGCMRSNGVPGFPDPVPGQVTAKFPGAQDLGVSASVYQTARSACQHLLPNGGSAPSQTEVQQELSGMRSFSGCMRSHGVPDWPDPIVDAQGRPVFDLGRAGISQSRARSPQLMATMHECGHLLPRSLPGIPIGGP
jgi:hypothetical protein